MKPGQYFGEMAVIEAWPRSTTIVAEEELHVIEIGEEALNDYFTEQPDKIYALICQLGGRIRELTDDYDEVKAFIEEKKNPEAKQKPGFLAKLKKYILISALARKNAGVTQEDVLLMKNFGKTTPDDEKVLECHKGQIIFREGDTGNYMYAVYGGSAGIYSNFISRPAKKQQKKPDFHHDQNTREPVQYRIPVFFRAGKRGSDHEHLY